MNFGFDLDKVFINYPPFVPDRLINSLYVKKERDKLIYRIPSKPEQILRKITHLSYFRPPIIENIRFTNNLTRERKNGNRYLISGRFGFLKNETHNIIKKYNFEKIFTSMFFNFDNEQPHVFKNRIIDRLELDRYVDDDLHLLKFLSQKNPKIVFFWLNKKHKKKLKNNIFAIKNLFEIID